MLISLVGRNVLRNRKRLLPLAVVLALTFAVLIVGNALLAYSEQSLYQTFARQISGDISVSYAGDQNFTLFGSDALLVGDLYVPEPILGFEELDAFVRTIDSVAEITPAVSGLAQVEIRNRSRNHTFLGVDFERFRRMFPDFELVDGSFPAPGERGILVQDSWPGTPVGQRALMSTARDVSFTLREVPVTGVFRFPVDEATLDRVVLVDPETARVLNNYVLGAVSDADRSGDSASGDFDRELDDLFGDSDPFLFDDPVDEADLESDRSVLDDLEDFFQQTTEEASAERQTVAGSWNFLLISARSRRDAPLIQAELDRAGFNRENGYLVRDWRRTVGGNAEIAWYLQIMFNVGIVFVTLGAIMITTNSLILSVLERTGEIGTMRAIGASRARVAYMLILETLLVVTGSAVVGIVGGVAVSGVINHMHIVVDNPFISLLFGGGALQTTVSPRLIVVHLVSAVVLTVIAMMYPLKRGLEVSPVEAMRT